MLLKAKIKSWYLYLLHPVIIIPKKAKQILSNKHKSWALTLLNYYGSCILYLRECEWNTLDCLSSQQRRFNRATKYWSHYGVTILPQKGNSINGASVVPARPFVMLCNWCGTYPLYIASCWMWHFLQLQNSQDSSLTFWFTPAYLHFYRFLCHGWVTALAACFITGRTFEMHFLKSFEASHSACRLQARYCR